MKKRMTCIAILSAALLALPAMAGPEGDAPKDGSKERPAAESRDGSHHDGPSGIMDDEIRDMVSTILMVRVSRSLELTDEQTVILVKHMQEMRDEISKLYAQRDESMKSLRELLDKESVTDDELNSKLDEVVAVDEKRAAAKRETFEKVAADLTPRQKAKLYVTLQDFEGQMRRMMQRAKEMGEDALREKLQEWNRGDGPSHSGPDRPMVKQFMKNRRPGPPPADGEAPPPAAPAEAKSE